MRTRPLMTLRLTTAPTQNLGAGPHGTRVTFPITGGTFEGDRLRGKVLPGGGDWTIKRPDGVLELDLRITLATDDGALIHMTFEGVRDDGAPGAPYFRTLPRFETDRTVTPTSVNPLGVKGVGEAGTIGSTPAIVNAVVDALQPFGVTHIDMPLRPEKLWRIMQENRHGRATA